MQKLLFSIVFSFWAVVVSAQVFTIPVTPEPLQSFPRCPLSMAQLNNRMFGVFGEQGDQFVYYSDDNGATWQKKPVSGYAEKVLVTGSNVLVFTRYPNGFGSLDYRIFRSTDNGGTFTQVFYFIETATYNGNDYGNETEPGLATVVNNVAYFTYTAHAKTGNNQTDGLRGFYSSDGGTTWNSLSSQVWTYGPATHILFRNGWYVLVTDRYSILNFYDAKVYRSNSAGFFNPQALPFNPTGNAPFSVAGAGMVGDILTLTAFPNQLFTRNINTPQQTYFSEDTLPFSFQESGFLNGNFYYLVQNDIMRAPGNDPGNMTKVFGGVYNGDQQDQLPFVQLGSTLNFMSACPLRSLDDGLSWTTWPTPGALPWTGALTVLDQRLLTYNAWAYTSTDGQSFSLWKPQGLPVGTYINPSRIITTQGFWVYLVSEWDSNLQTSVTAVYRSADQGLTWNKVQTLPDDTYFIQSGKYGNRIYESVGLYDQTYKMYYSDDAGLNWQSFALGSGAHFAAHGDTVFLLNNNTVQYTYDAGQQWSSTSLPITGSSWNQLFYHNGRVAVSVYNGGIIYQSTDEGQSFVQVADLPVTGYYSCQQFDSLLVMYGGNNLEVYVAKMSNLLRWGRVEPQTNWTYMSAQAVFGGYLYGSQESSFWVYDNSPAFTRIPINQILDALNSQDNTAAILKGNIFADSQAPNCQFNGTDVPLEGRMVTVQPGNYLVATNDKGYYGLALPVGTYTVSTTPFLYHNENCLAQPTVSLTNGQTLVQNIGYTAATVVRDLRVSVMGTRLRPGREAYFTIKVTNVGTQAVPAGATLELMYPDNALSFVSANPVAGGTGTGSVTFSLPVIAPYASVEYTVTLKVLPDPLLTGQLLTFNALVADNYGDAQPSDNADSFSELVTNSFDPNDKTAVTPAPLGDQVTILDKTVKYLIRFQNTGTDTAFRVVVRDTLSDLLDPATLETIDASHPYKFALRNGKVAEWYFDPIGLPDSTSDEAGSHGFVYFKIKAKPQVKLGDELKNTAGIFFDFNDPVFTNTTNTRVVRRIVYRDGETPAAAVTASVYPNPAAETAVLEVSTAGQWQFDLTDALGRVVETAAFAGSTYEILRKNLPAGAYTWAVRQGGAVVAQGNLIFR